MVRRIVALGLLCGCLGFALPAKAQGLWIGGIGFGGPGLYGAGISPFGFGPAGFYGSGFAPYGVGSAVSFGGYAPATFAYPVAAAPVYVARPVSYGVAPAYVPRPAVRAPLNRAYRRAWRNGW